MRWLHPKNESCHQFVEFIKIIKSHRQGNFSYISGFYSDEINSSPVMQGEFFKFTYKNGLKGYFFDSLRVSWATQGPMIYIHMALGWDPEMDVETLRQDFWSAFGPAAGQIEKYFDFWEAYSLAHPQGSLYSPIRANAAYPPAVFAKPEAMLKAALKTVANHSLPEFAERVKFLQAGLEHARLSAKFMGTLDMGKVPTDREGFLKAQQALKELVAYRRAAVAVSAIRGTCGNAWCNNCSCR